MAEIRRVGSDKPVITRGMGGTAKLTPLVGHLQVDSTDDAAVSALVGNPATATRSSLSAAYAGVEAPGTPAVALDKSATTQTKAGKLVLGTSGDINLEVYNGLQWSSAIDAMQVLDTAGTNGRRLRIQPKDQATSTKSTQLELLPGANVAPAAQCTTQILLYNKTGADYERFAFSCVNNQYVIDSTYNGLGAARNIYVQMGGSVSNAIAGRNAVILRSDASVLLPGGTYVADGKTWHAERTRIIDDGNTGDCRLILDTRTGLPTSNVADDAVIELQRGGSRKWVVGLNWAGNNADTLDFYSTGLALQLTTTLSAVIAKSAPATTATDGFPYIPVMAGTPTGVPTAKTGYVPIVFDSTGLKLWVYIGGSWKGVVVA